MTIEEKILAVAAKSPGLTEAEIARRIFGPSGYQQQVNPACRKLVGEGLLVRRKDRPYDNYGAYYTSDGAQNRRTNQSPQRAPAKTGGGSGELSEDEIKQVLKSWLENDGWKTEIAWSRKPGIDIDARRGNKRWIIEVKGPGSLSAMRVNYFIGVLGETLQRMSDADASYSVAFPDMRQFRGLWERLPALAKSRTKISALFVDSSGYVKHETD